jgi:hypothetical protein
MTLFAAPFSLIEVSNTIENASLSLFLSPLSSRAKAGGQEGCRLGHDEATFLQSGSATT